jgi:LysM repeat protein
MAANGLSSTTIYVGQRLTIPSGSGGSSSSGGTASSTVHVVQPGETLTRIGLRYGVTTGALQQANNLASPDLIYVGQRLAIPTGGSGTGSTSGGGTSYTVRRGDTLSGIAARFGTTAGAIASANGIVNPSLIFAGQTLQIPAGGGVSPAVPAGGNKRIIIDLSDQHLYAYQGGQLVYSFLASTGRAGASTWPGEYRVQSKIPRAYGSTWNIWMPYWLGVYWAGSLENGIHALPVTPGGQVLWAEYLGRPISFGCIVLGTEQARLLYNWAPIGTPVSIRW